MSKSYHSRLAPLSQPAFEKLSANAVILEQDRRGPKVLKLVNNNILKIFTSRSRLSKSWWRPYSIRFATNAQALKQRDINTVDICALYKLATRGKTAVEYAPLPGNTLDKCIAGHPDKEGLSEQLGIFIGKLHERGVYFRALHPGNILLDGDTWGLIDIADLRCYSNALDTTLRKRNFHHLMRRERFIECLQQLSCDKLQAGYCHHGGSAQSAAPELTKIWQQHLG